MCFQTHACVLPVFAQIQVIVPLSSRFRPVSRRFVAGHLAIKRPLNAHQPPMGDIVEL